MKENSRKKGEHYTQNISLLDKALSFYQAGDLRNAAIIYKQLLRKEPKSAEVLNLLGVVYSRLGNHDSGIKLISQAISINPSNSAYYNNLAKVCRENRDFKEAIPHYQQALKLDKDNIYAHNGLGLIFYEQNRLYEAIACYKNALKINPNHVESLNNMGLVLHKLKSFEDAIKCFKHVLKINPNYVQFHSNLAISYKECGMIKESIESFERALVINPNDKVTIVNLFHELQAACDWNKLEKLVPKLDRITDNDLAIGRTVVESLFINFARHTDLSRNFAVARSRSSDIERVMPGLKMNFSFDERRSDKAKKIIVDYLSNDFRNHAMAHLTLGLYGLHNRDEFKVFCYSYGEDDGSYYSTRIRQDCDKFVELRNLDHPDAARRIYKDQVDILVDLKGHSKGVRLEISAHRPAPIQVRYLGLACTTGAGFFDYIITDRIVMPEDHTRYYSENFVYLPHCYQINDHTQDISNKDWKKSDFGLPENSFVFCSFNQCYKIEPVMFDNWMKVLRQVPESVLWLQRINVAAKKNLRREAEARGVKPSRLVFAEKLQKCEHLARLRLADLALDTRIVNGAITTSDALWAGVPVITMQGGSFASRMSSSILNAIGLPELITHTLEEYESLAIDLAHNPGKLQMIRQKIVENRLAGPLFDTPRFTRDLEKSYKKMWEIFVAGERPRQIGIEES